MPEIDASRNMFDRTKVPVWEIGQLGGRIYWINQFILFDNLCDVIDVFTKHGIRYALSHGTVLGLVKLNQLIPWDDDIDITLFTEDMSKMPAAEAELRAKGYWVPTRTDNPSDKVNPLEKGYWYDFNAIKGGEKIEGWFTDKIGDKYVYDKYREGLAWDRKFFDNLGTIVWNKRTFNCPAYIDEYIKLMYKEAPISYENKAIKYNPVK